MKNVGIVIVSAIVVVGTVLLLKTTAKPVPHVNTNPQNNPNNTGGLLTGAGNLIGNVFPYIFPDTTTTTTTTTNDDGSGNDDSGTA